MSTSQTSGMPFSLAYWPARRDLVGAPTADEQEGAFILDHLAAHLHSVLRVELVVSEDDPPRAAERHIRAFSARNFQ